MEHWFTYRMYAGNTLLRIGKGHCATRSDYSVIAYLRRRYGREHWSAARIAWHISESAALKREAVEIDGYLQRHDELPPWNEVRGGGGRQIYVKCVALTQYGAVCANDALAGNYSFCGIHRRSLS